MTKILIRQKMNLEKLKQKKTAFVLSGGVIKAGAWHLGVSKALEELGFSFKSHKSIHSDLEIGTFVGSSAGALISVALASGHSPKNIIDMVSNPKKSVIKKLSYKDILSVKKISGIPKVFKDYGPFNDLPFPLNKVLSPLTTFSGLFSTKGIGKYLTKNVIKYDDFRDYEADLFIVTSQLDHSRKVIFGKYQYPNSAHDEMATYRTDASVVDAASASMSVPPVYSPYGIRNPDTNKEEFYIDGDIRDTLSTHVAVDHGQEVIISSWTHTPYHYSELVGSLINYGLPAICIQSIYLMIQKKIISYKKRNIEAKELIETVHYYMKNENFSEKQRKEVLEILETKLNYNKDRIFIDIYPSHENHEFFFSSFFSLNSKISKDAIKMGYDRTFEVFEKMFR